MSASVSYSFSPTTTIESSQVNQNFTDLVNYLNNTACVTGMVSMWAGAIGSIPTGWQLCNGSGGAPDLRDKFIIGAGNLSVGDTGGEATHTLTTAELPAHSHSGSLTSKNSVGSSGSRVAEGDNSGGSGAVSFSTGNTGSGNAHENRPPYYALAFIYKT